MTTKDGIIDLFTQKEAIHSPSNTKTAFIIANERSKQDGTVGRYYTVFPEFELFLKNRHKYKHCHEQLIDHTNNTIDPTGRLVFDFDIKIETIPKNFKDQVESTILEVIETYMQDVDTDKLKFIWSSCINPKKFSKHLTVKHFYFDNWIELSKIFYQLFCLIWDEKYIWINSDGLVDFQIVRKGASLRMVGSSKIGGKVLTMDDQNHTLVESLIRIYQEKHRKKEQVITKQNFMDAVFTDILKPIIKHEPIIKNYPSEKIIDSVYDNKVYYEAFRLCEKIYGILSKRKHEA